MKNDNASKISYIEKARKITSREYLMKLIYQIDMKSYYYNILMKVALI